jgi:hypothetical protein
LRTSKSSRNVPETFRDDQNWPLRGNTESSIAAVLLGTYILDSLTSKG